MGAKVSIIIPVCNVEKYLRVCLESVKNQTLKDIEIICVDDGSKDSSLAILMEYESKDSRFNIITKPNAGYGHTMNMGMAAATGEYIGIVESDDYVKTDMFEKLYNAAKQNDADVVKSDYYIFETSDDLEISEYKNTCKEEYYNRVLNGENCREIFNFAMMNWTGIYRRTFIEENQIRHNESPGASFQDNGFWFQTFVNAKKIVFINEAFYYYRQDNPNSSINDKRKVFTICDEYEFIKKYLISHPELASKYYGIFLAKRFFNYDFTYNKLLEEHKNPFLERAAVDFRNDLKSEFYRDGIVGKWVIEQIQKIITTAPKHLEYKNDNWYVFQNNSLLSDYTGLVWHDTCWYYVTAGVFDKKYVGITEYNKKLWYITDGKINKTYEGVVELHGKKYKILNGEAVFLG